VDTYSIPVTIFNLYHPPLRRHRENVEKVFYQFLYERKCEFLERGFADAEDQYEDPSM